MKKTLLYLLACSLVISCSKRHYIENTSPIQLQSRPVTSISQAVPSTAVQSAAVEKKHNKPKGSYWGDVEYDGQPWVKNVSRPFDITRGLYNRHLSVWQSHGRYYDQDKGRWKCQRPNLFCTTEDLFTQTIVVPYLIPMLEKAGANVFTPRERDWQRNEAIVDNDDPPSEQYRETNGSIQWEDAGCKGFAWRKLRYTDGENPFESGSARRAKASRTASCEIAYQPYFPESGAYAVYVSYSASERNVDDASYTVYHQGQTTVFHVNQRMGAGTWVYLGTFQFDKGCSAYNRVTLTNQSQQKGYVTADAVRFGGGMGNTVRGGSTSGYPRFLEGARYYAQWAGAPYAVYSRFNGANDYNDDITTRSYMSNWLAGGSCYLPDTLGKLVPLELTLGVHSDAGFHRDYQSIYGSLGIYYTKPNNGLLHSGLSRQASGLLINSIADCMKRDLPVLFGQWVFREVRDANYSETRCPEIPSAIIETLSHQSLPDLKLGMDPNFRFFLARSIYKGLLKYVCQSHNCKYTIAPLPPEALRMEFISYDRVKLSWDKVEDPLEPSASPAAYVLYTATGSGDFDNGTVVKSTSCSIQLQPGIVYRFRVTAINDGGESFPSHTLSALCHAGASRTIMIIDGFNRLAAPAIKETATEQGFDLSEDPGVSYINTAGFCGPQIDYDKKNIGIEGPGGLGFSGSQWEGMVIAGNTFNNAYDHCEAMKGILDCNVVSCSSKAVEQGYVDLSHYPVVDLLLGMEKADGNPNRRYKTFSISMQDALTRYVSNGGSVLASGAYLASDMRSVIDSTFMSRVFKMQYAGQTRVPADSIVSGMGTTMKVYHQINEAHYAATVMDILQPQQPAFATLTYSSGLPAGVAYQGKDYRTFVMGFPFECINSYRKRAAVMKGIINFLMER